MEANAVGLRLSMPVAPAHRSTRLVVVEMGARSDEELLELIAEQRDCDAFDELYRRYSRAVYGVVRRMLVDHAPSEDVVQEAFTNVWRAAAGYRRDRGVATGWLFAIARNAAADALRARGALTMADPPEQADSEPGPDDRVARDMAAFRVHAAVDTLPPREREVINLAYFEGLSQSEVAERLAIPLGTVKTRTRSGLARLAEMLSTERMVS